MDDWDLLAVVRGRNNNNYNMESPISSTNNNNMGFSSPSSSFVPLSVQDQEDLLFNTYPRFFESVAAFDELEELYKPFYPASTALHASSSSSLSSSSSSPIVSVPKQPEQHFSPKPKIAKESANKYKKRKNQQKRVVKEVREDGLGSDMWAWRKYGQKPIKGSPYPRSYYRCSSSKGCSARKQVERSPSNPEIFIITYTAEHSHAHPTRRNSLAGTIRSKFPSATRATNGDNLDSKPNNNNDTIMVSSKDVHDNDDDDTNYEVSDELGQEAEDGNVGVKMDCDHEEDSIASEVDVKSHPRCQLFASLDDLERGLEELDHEETSDIVNKSSDELLDGELFFDDHFVDSNWFVDQCNNTSVTGAC